MRPFDTVKSARPGRSLFDLSYDKKFTCDMGQLIPVLCDECVPGDVWQIGNGMVVRFQPLVAPIMHEVDARVDYFFVPYRLLWSDWEKFITGGIDGNNASVLPRYQTSNRTAGSLWDYFGFPIFDSGAPTDAEPLAFPQYAYSLLYNQYYRDETLDPEVVITAQNFSSPVRVRWEKDYFTAALPWQQRGTAPALPISGMTSAQWADADIILGSGQTNVQVHSTAGQSKLLASTNDAVANLRAFFDKNTVDLSTASTFDVADLRLAFAIQTWMERNARCGARYTEFLQAHFGVSPRDDRLQRAEYIGGSRSPMVISEVLQTGSTDATSPQGNMAGHGLTADGRMIGRYHVQEYGLIMGLLNVRPKPAYQQGIDRQWLRRTRYDFYHPEFANLSEQGIEEAEIYATTDGTANRGIFGFAGRYDEMRYKRNQVCAEMRSTLAYWHLGRIFSSPPALNGSFLSCEPDKRIFAVPSEPGLIVNFHNSLRVLRPIPIQSNPGLIDHTYGG